MRRRHTHTQKCITWDSYGERGGRRVEKKVLTRDYTAAGVL